jgi:hypothetical protein
VRRGINIVMGIGMSRCPLHKRVDASSDDESRREPLSFKPYKIENVFNWVKPVA